MNARHHRKRNTQSSFYKNKPYKSTSLQKPKDIEHIKNTEGFQKPFP